MRILDGNTSDQRRQPEQKYCYLLLASLSIALATLLICFAIVVDRSTMHGQALELQLWAAQSQFLLMSKLSEVGKGHESAAEDWQCFLGGP